MTAESVLLEQHAITAEQLSHAIAERYGLDHLDLSVFKVDMAAANLLSAAAARRYRAVPVAYVDEHTLLLAMADPANVLAVDDIALLTRMDVKPAVASAEDIRALITRMNRFEDAVQEAVDEGEEGAAPARDRRPARVRRGRAGDQARALDHRRGGRARRLRHPLRAAARRARPPRARAARADADRRRARRLGDGPAAGWSAGVVSRIKIMSDLDISERRVPQDGRVGLTIEGRHIDIRVVTLPRVNGESVVLRILDKEAIRLELERARHCRSTSSSGSASAFTRAHGAVLATGPTGSGKSTTLYGALAELNTPEKNIITIEDPVEYQIQGITQVQINTKAGLTFAPGCAR